MSYELFIGLRYLKAKRKQTFISIITFISITGVMVGVTALIVVLSVMTGFEEDLRDKILGVNAHLVVLELGKGMDEYKIVAEKAKNVDGVVGTTPFIYNQAMISTETGVVGVVVRGMDIDTVGDVTILPKRIKQGSLEGLRNMLQETYAKDSQLPGIAIGRELSRSLGIALNEEVNLISPSGIMTAAGPVPRIARFKVSGIFEFGMYEYDSSMAFISLENAKRFFRMGDTVTGVEVRIEDIYVAEEIGRHIQKAAGGFYYVRTWMDMNKNLFSALKLEKIAMFIILTLIILVAAFNIISTLIMVVMEKGKDIAILKSMGATAGSIMRIFMIEGLVIGITGTLAGVASGVAISFHLERIVGVIEWLFGFKVLRPDVYYIDKLPSKVDPYTVITIAIVAIIISFVATIYPSWRASKFDPVEALRYE
ncbi:MAG TPA: lipoprotein-releasing ABC transporter permease subunit [Deltaproteobacteria bacterium]|nr:MAG: ABC transporter permease [Deltaproteobacteria bacterium GWD2_42_10]OGP47761.1 MAG: ABC transporter permease [Deltaproteobacteria bacterium GWF2_42_12]OGQ38643.1 MAG: ABC transporter permease [Deltaproteobacteria bacterium RIFCSPLOWO2_02_FULL_42_39]OGQ67810.1 MAG: ABC transporter permease [Deltaproteobacteria bacterium RIFCSPLOWO2_12_FULL_42_16]OGQ76559.1 MAG: ABC transporter permease [Deltaproteobacteria bacterium RIFOXYA2_FULL_42_10]HAG51870.1 lipoprotein-releasing ABC transporter per